MLHMNVCGTVCVLLTSKRGVVFTYFKSLIKPCKDFTDCTDKTHPLKSKCWEKTKFIIRTWYNKSNNHSRIGMVLNVNSNLKTVCAKTHKMPTSPLQKCPWSSLSGLRLPHFLLVVPKDFLIHSPIYFSSFYHTINLEYSLILLHQNRKRTTTSPLFVSATNILFHFKLCMLFDLADTVNFVPYVHAACAAKKRGGYLQCNNYSEEIW